MYHDPQREGGSGFSDTLLPATQTSGKSVSDKIRFQKRNLLLGQKRKGKLWLLIALNKWSGQAVVPGEGGGGSSMQLMTRLTSSSPTTEIAVFTESKLCDRLFVSILACVTIAVEHLASRALVRLYRTVAAGNPRSTGPVPWLVRCRQVPWQRRPAGTEQRRRQSRSWWDCARLPGAGQLCQTA